MKRKPSPWGWAKRPQLWLLVIAVGFTAWAGGSAAVSPPSVAPPQVASAHREVPWGGLPSPAQARAPQADCQTRPCIALTFDDGPDRDFTPPILDALQRHNVRATFFVLGVHAERHPELVRREYREGHEVGNHSWDHTDMTRLNPSQIQDQVTATQRIIMQAGVPAPTLFRPPYGAVNEAVLAHVPLTVVRWNIDPEDWKVKQSMNIVEHTDAFARPGGVIILHDTEQYTAEALETVLQHLEGRYQFVTVSELFNLPPGQRGQFFGR